MVCGYEKQQVCSPSVLLGLRRRYAYLLVSTRRREREKLERWIAFERWNVMERMLNEEESNYSHFNGSLWRVVSFLKLWKITCYLSSKAKKHILCAFLSCQVSWCMPWPFLPEGEIPLQVPGNGTFERRPKGSHLLTNCGPPARSKKGQLQALWRDFFSQLSAFENTPGFREYRRLTWFFHWRNDLLRRLMYHEININKINSKMEQMKSKLGVGILAKSCIKLAPCRRFSLKSHQNIFKVSFWIQHDGRVISQLQWYIPRSLLTELTKRPAAKKCASRHEYRIWTLRRSMLCICRISAPLRVDLVAKMSSRENNSASWNYN